MLVGLLLMMHESPFPLQAMLKKRIACALIQRSFQTTLPAGGVVGWGRRDGGEAGVKLQRHTHRLLYKANLLPAKELERA